MNFYPFGQLLSRCLSDIHWSHVAISSNKLLKRHLKVCCCGFCFCAVVTPHNVPEIVATDIITQRLGIVNLVEESFRRRSILKFMTWCLLCCQNMNFGALCFLPKHLDLSEILVEFGLGSLGLLLWLHWPFPSLEASRTWFMLPFGSWSFAQFLHCASLAGQITWQNDWGPESNNTLPHSINNLTHFPLPPGLMFYPLFS